MKQKELFMNMFKGLPPKARRELVYDFTGNPMTLNVCAVEIRNDTKLGKRILKDLGYETKC